MLKNVLPLSFIIATRFFGLFLVLPVMSVEGLKLHGATPHNVGLLVGVYAIAQMIFQVPFGALSDRVGRKFAMTLGLAVFVAGSVICAFCESFEWMLAGRVLQGSGAVGGVASAMIADLTTPQNRSKAMAMTGIFTGLAFCAAMALAPLLNAWVGFSFLFHLTSFLTLVCIALLFFVVDGVGFKPAPKKPKFSLGFITNSNLMILNVSSFLQKMFLSAALVAIPLVYVAGGGEIGAGGGANSNLAGGVGAAGADLAGAGAGGTFNGELANAYILGAVVGFVAMGLAGALGDKLRLNKAFVTLGIALFAGSFWALGAGAVFAGAVAFFAAFCLHEPSMQTLASKFAPKAERGVVLGVFISGGYAGSFVGGAVSAFLVSEFGAAAFFGGLVAVCGVWFLLALALKRDPLPRAAEMAEMAANSASAGRNSAQNSATISAQIPAQNPPQNPAQPSEKGEK